MRDLDFPKAGLTHIFNMGVPPCYSAVQQCRVVVLPIICCDPISCIEVFFFFLILIKFINDRFESGFHFKSRCYGDIRNFLI